MEFFADQSSAFNVAPIIRHLDEFYNGSGKPDGLKEEQIPMGARVISVVRAFEEMLRSKLVKDPTEVAKVAKLLRKGADKKFDPRCVEAFVQVLEGESFLENAGATFVDRSVVVDAHLVSSRTPADLPDFLKAMIANLAR